MGLAAGPDSGFCSEPEEAPNVPCGICLHGAFGATSYWVLDLGLDLCRSCEHCESPSSTCSRTSK